MKNFDSYNWMIFLVFWGLSFVATVFSLLAENSTLGGALVGASLITLVLGLIAYIHIRYLTSFLQQRQWLRYFFSIVSLLTVSLCVEYLTIEWLYQSATEEYTVWQFVIAILPFNIISIAVSVTFHVLSRGWMKAVQEKADLKNEKLTSELNLLKAQINPHFLFNTLNNIYFYASIQHEDTPDMIEKLSSILRYIVYDCKAERISLNREIQSMEHLFSLYQMKNDEQKAIIFEKTNVTSNLQIAPLILLNLLENVFKHSDALVNEDGFIKVRTNVDAQDVLHFQISNSVKKSSRNKENGVGQTNVQKQLDLIYKNKYNLKTEVSNNVFHLNLNIQLDR